MKKLFFFLVSMTITLPCWNMSSSYSDIYQKKDSEPCSVLCGDKNYVLFRKIVEIWKDKNHPFSMTDIFIYKNGTYSYQGTLQNLNFKLLKEIYFGNYIFMPCYRLKVTAAKEFYAIGALIIGAQDKVHIKKFIYTQISRSLTFATN